MLLGNHLPEKLRFGLVGLGYWGPNLLRVLVDNPGIDVAWICDRDEERLARFAARYPSVQATTEFQTMLDDDELDAVVIATPVFSHVELCTRSLIAGKHTFVEKPLTAIVPLSVQSRYGSGGSAEAAGLIPSDVLMLAGLARAAVVLPHQRLDRRSSVLVGLTLAFLVVVALQLVHAVGLGRPLSGSGSEVRALLGFGTVLVALPILCDRRARVRLARSLVGLGIVLGAWGVAQYALDIRFDAPGDLGASSTSSFTTAGRVVGMYAFTVAAIVALAALTSGTVRGRWARAALAVVLALNCIAIVVTFERTFMVATLIGFAVLFVRGGVAQRRRLAVWAPAAAVVTGLALAALAPSILSAAGGRLASLGDYGTDASVAYRVAESRLVGKQIRARPLIGSGLGATIQTGRPNTTQPIRPRRYAENGYLWLGWKLGIPGAAVLWLLLGLCIAWPVSRLVDAGTWGLVSGCQAALTALAVATIAFPSFTSLRSRRSWARWRPSASRRRWPPLRAVAGRRGHERHPRRRDRPRRDRLRAPRQAAQPARRAGRRGLRPVGDAGQRGRRALRRRSGLRRPRAHARQRATRRRARPDAAAIAPHAGPGGARGGSPRPGREADRADPGRIRRDARRRGSARPAAVRELQLPLLARRSRGAERAQPR